MQNNQRTSLIAHITWLSFLLASLVYLFSSLHVVSDISQFMPDDHKNKDVQLLLDELQQGSTARLLIIRLSGDDTLKLASISKQLRATLEKNTHIGLVHNGQKVLNLQQLINNEYKLLFNYRYLLSENTAFTKEALSASLKQRLTELRTGITLFKNTLATDPQNHFSRFLYRLQERAKNTHLHGVWFDKDKASALLLVELNLKNFDLDHQQQALNEINHAIDPLTKNKNITVDISGTASMAVQTRSAIQSTTKWLSGTALILMSLLFWWSYRSAHLFFIAMLPLASAIIAALAITNIIFNQVHGIIIAFGITLLGVCIDYPVHLFSHHTKSRDPQQTILSIWPTLRLGVITTALAYLAMLGTGFTGLSQLAVFAISGLIISLLVTRWIVPAWLRLNFNKQEHPYLKHLSILTFSAKSRLVSAIAVIAFCFLIINANLTSMWSENISDLSPVPAKAKLLDQELRHSIGAPEVNHVFLIKDHDTERLLQRTESMVTRLNVLKQNKQVNNIFSVTDFIPSKQTQRLYQQQLPQRNELVTNLNTVTASLPFKKYFFTPFIDDVSASKDLNPISVAEFYETPLAKHIQQDLFFKENNWISIVRLSGVHDEAALLSWIDTEASIKPHYLNLRQATSSLMSDYQQTALSRLLLGSLIIGLILLMVRPLKRMGIILLPVVLAVLLSISIQVLLGTQLNLFHILALLLIVGIGLDYSLFFDRKWTSLEDYQHRLHGIFISASSTLITFGILGFSDIPVLAALGQTVSYGVLGCFVLTLLFNIKREKA
ncbi:MAG: MMPL family transporter [Gammaproteobacteria bacterium]|nr:MMPL family transporter [Gammaproteobacteria bacterium]